MAKAKAKAKSKSKVEKASKETDNKAAKKNEKQSEDANPVEMRRTVTNILNGELAEITVAVAGEAKKGQLATVKYLFEVIGLYPTSAEADAMMNKPEEDTFTKRVLRRFGMPEGPLPSEEEDPPEKLAIPAAKANETSVIPEAKKVSEGTAEGHGENAVAEAASVSTSD